MNQKTDKLPDFSFMKERKEKWEEFKKFCNPIFEEFSKKMKIKHSVNVYDSFENQCTLLMGTETQPKRRIEFRIIPSGSAVFVFDVVLPGGGIPRHACKGEIVSKKEIFEQVLAADAFLEKEEFPSHFDIYPKK